MGKTILPDWYGTKIEPEIRRAVRALRDQGVNTTASCGHGMWVEGSAQYGEEAHMIVSLLADLGYTDFNLTIYHRCRGGHMSEPGFILNLRPSDEPAKAE